ncbi:hypothetical protein Tco_1446777 [Tanacetum coccineum]
MLRFKVILMMFVTAAQDQAVEKRFGGECTIPTKKTQRNLLKQQYENFTASSSEVLDQTFDRLQKLISQLEIHGESLESVEARLLVYKKNESVYEEDIKVLKREIHLREDKAESKPKIEKKRVKSSFAKIEFVKPKGKTDRKTAKQVEHNRQNTHIPRGNQRNWNNMMSQN